MTKRSYMPEDELEHAKNRAIAEQANCMGDGIFYCNYGVGWIWPDGTIHCLLCGIDKAFPDEYAVKDAIIPLVHTDEEWCLHFLNYHANTRRPGNVMARYVPHLGGPLYERGSWWWKQQQKKYREEKKRRREIMKGNIKEIRI